MPGVPYAGGVPPWGWEAGEGEEATPGGYAPPRFLGLQRQMRRIMIKPMNMDNPISQALVSARRTNRNPNKPLDGSLGGAVGHICPRHAAAMGSPVDGGEYVTSTRTLCFVMELSNSTATSSNGSRLFSAGSMVYSVCLLSNIVAKFTLTRDSSNDRTCKLQNIRDQIRLQSYSQLTLSIPSSRSTFSQHFRLGSVIIFRSTKL